MKKIISQISKKLLAALLILWASVTVSAQDKSVVVISKDGSTHTVALGKVDRLDFGQSAMSVRDVSGSVKELAYSEIDKVLIGELSSILNKLPDEGSLAVWPLPFTDRLNVSGLTEGSEIRLFDLKGTCVASATMTDARVNTLETGTLCAGVYVLTCGIQIIKVVRK